MQSLAQGPALLYFWAEWCGVCRTMQNNVDAVLQDYPGMTVAVRSDDRQKLTNYLAKNQLNWPTINDVDGAIGQRYGIRGVPALFFINQQGSIVFTSIGYTSEWGLRIRLWLASMF
jgi:thiol-disulfide isomerase/thioredoxin